MNARIQKPSNNREHKIVGAYTFQPESARTGQLGDGTTENRRMLIDLCRESNLILLNTLFRKRNETIVTYREIGTKREEEITREKYEQIDYIITSNLFF